MTSAQAVTLSRLAAALTAAGHQPRLVGDVATVVTSVAYDSRQVEPGALFVALRGAATDGHAYLPAAIARGARALLVEELPADHACANALVVANSRAALACVAATFYRLPSDHLGLIGITGTKGKTTTSFLTEAILHEAGLVTGLIGTVDLKVGSKRWRNPVHQTTPESLAVQRLLAEMVAAGVTWAVLETSSHALETHRVDYCSFDAVAFTNVTHEHLDFHGTFDNYLAAKAKLLDRVVDAERKGLPRRAVFNRDDPAVASLMPRRPELPTLTYGLSDGCDVRARDVATTAAGLTFALDSPWGAAQAATPLIGQFNVYNALAATALALGVGVSLDAVLTALRQFTGVPGRLQRVDAGQPFTLIVDYAHNPDSLRQVLALLRPLTAGRLIALFGSAGERDRAKRPLMGRVCAEGADFGVFTDEDPRGEDRVAILEEIAAGARLHGWRQGTDYVVIPDREEAIEYTLRRARPTDVVVLAGKGHEQTIEYEGASLPWDEAGVARAVLDRLGYGLGFGR